MKVGFIFDTKFVKYGDDYYTTNLSAEVLTKRYLTVFDEMTVIGRRKEVLLCPSEKLSKANSDSIHFRCIKNRKPMQRLVMYKTDNDIIGNYIKDCDFVICRGWRGAKICEKAEKPYLLEVVNCAWDSYWNHGIVGKIVAPIMYFAQRKAVKNSTYVIYVTNEFLQKRYPTNGKSISISNVELSTIDEDVLNNRLQAISKKREDRKIVIGTAGGVDVPFKGQRFVIEALGLLKKRGYLNVEYQIAGSGDQTRLKEIASKNNVEDQVIFKGSIIHDKMFEWYDTLDIYIQPSLQEGLPRALIEAMSRGIVCYGTKTGGIPELLDKEFVCSSNRFIAKKLAAFIESYNRDCAMIQCDRNIKKAREYEKNVLEERRESFLREFTSRNKRMNDE